MPGPKHTRPALVSRCLPLALAALTAVGCRNATGIDLTVDGRAAGIDQLRITATFGGHASTQLVPPAPAPLSLPASLFAGFDVHAATTVVLDVEALRAGAPVAAAVSDAITVTPGRTAYATVFLDDGASDGAAPRPGDLAIGGGDMNGGGGGGGGGGDLGAPGDMKASAYAAAVLADHPLAYYRLDESAGTIAFDLSGNMLHADRGAKITRTDGLLVEKNGAVDLSGSDVNGDGIVAVAMNGQFETGTITVELWLRQAIANPDGTHLVGYGETLLDDPSYGVVLAGGGHFATYLATKSSSSGTRVSSTTQAQPNKTYHVVETYDGATVRLYVNGALEAEKALAGGIAYNSLRSGLGIGASPLATPGDPITNGVLDEVALYPTALGAARVHAHYVAGTTP